MADHRLILRLAGDFYIKSRKTRARFQRRLAANVRHALTAQQIPFHLERTWSRFYVETPEPGAAAILARVFGVQSVSVVERRAWKTLDELVRQGVEFFASAVAKRSFAVRASRRGDRSRLGFDSMRVEAALGRALLDAGAGRVDLSAPEVTAYVEVEPEAVHFFLDKLAGPGGLPIGVEGRALSLLSGGFDSAVASWLTLKRGVRLDYLFFRLGGSAQLLGALKVGQALARLWSSGTRPRLIEIDFSSVVEEVRAKTREEHWQVLLKRLMLRAAALIAQRHGRPALVTGDAIGQVSSQTLDNLVVVSQAVPEMLILRPLVGFNKDEIVNLSRRIGIYDLSAAVAEYCDMMPRRPATKAVLSAVLADEARLDMGRLDQLLAARTLHDLRTAHTEGTGDLEIDHVPPGATVLDLRPAHAFRAWHHPSAVQIDLARALASLNAFDREPAYVAVCEVGLKSAYLVERMREAGFQAWHLTGGIGRLLELARKDDEALATLLAPAVR
jgi:thiamine biosynthesis protein ThiI